MLNYTKDFFNKVNDILRHLPEEEIVKSLGILQATYERGGNIYVFGNGGSLALATHWVSDFNKTVFSHHLDKDFRRFRAIRIPTTESELTAWANDVGYDMVFLGPLKNYLMEKDAVIAISSSGNSENIVKAVRYAKKRGVPIIGLSGFDGGNLNEIADAKILVATDKEEYEIVEGVHDVILHMMVKYFKDYFDYVIDKNN